MGQLFNDLMATIGVWFTSVYVCKALSVNTDGIMVVANSAIVLYHFFG